VVGPPEAAASRAEGSPAMSAVAPTVFVTSPHRAAPTVVGTRSMVVMTTMSVLGVATPAAGAELRSGALRLDVAFCISVYVSCHEWHSFRWFTVTIYRYLSSVNAWTRLSFPAGCVSRLVRIQPLSGRVR
jgi:hypothetical protein